MPEALKPVTPAAPKVIADAAAFALRFDERKRRRDAGEFMAAIVAKRPVERLDRAGFAVMKRPPSTGAAAPARGAAEMLAAIVATRLV